MAGLNKGIGLARLLFAVAVVLTVTTLALLIQYLSGADERALKNFDSAQVLVATQAISRGTSLSVVDISKLVEAKNFPVNSVPDNSLQEINASNSQLVALSDIAPGQILIGDNFGARVKPAIDFNLPAGQVAITVELNYASKVATFVKPGVSVAVFATTAVQNNRPSKTSLLFKSLEVLAVGQQTDLSQSVPTDEIANFITLSVPYDSAGKLVDAFQNSKLHLALLSDSSLLGLKTEQG